MYSPLVLLNLKLYVHIKKSELPSQCLQFWYNTAFNSANIFIGKLWKTWNLADILKAHADHNE